jgi:hypothetical protein
MSVRKSVPPKVAALFNVLAEPVPDPVPVVEPVPVVDPVPVLAAALVPLITMMCS